MGLKRILDDRALTGQEATTMRTQLLLAAFIAAAAVIPAAAQGPYGYPPGRGGRGPGPGAYGNSYGRSPARFNPVAAAQRDLVMIFRRARVDGHEANHFRHALQELNDFHRNATRGRFDQRSMERALDNMGDLARADQLHPRDRQIIRARMDDLRMFLRGGRW